MPDIPTSRYPHALPSNSSLSKFAHLDRQLGAPKKAPARGFGGLGVLGAVSYTHLDVYKRQEYYRMDGTVVGPVLTTDSAGWNGMYGMHRADLLAVLADALPPGTVRTSHCCIGFEQNDLAGKLTFANGETAEADIVIAADGIHSTLQKFVIEPSLPEYSGSRAYRGLISSEKLPGWRRQAHQIWMGQGKHFMVFPVRSGQLLNYVGFVPTENETVESWSAVGNRDEFAASFAGWDPRVTGLLDKVESCFWWGLYDRRPLSSWRNGRLVLLGDAEMCIRDSLISPPPYSVISIRASPRSITTALQASKPVSYTHLDVYKRQAPAFAASRDIPSGRLIAALSLWRSCASPGAVPSSVRMNGRVT